MRCRRHWASGCRPTAIHDPGKIVAVALGGDCLADIATVRAEPAVFGLVASDPTVSRLIDTLALDADKALAAIAAARARAGFTLPDDAVRRIAQIPDQAWTPAYDDERTPRDASPTSA